MVAIPDYSKYLRMYDNALRLTGIQNALTDSAAFLATETLRQRDQARIIDTGKVADVALRFRGLGDELEQARARSLVGVCRNAIQVSAESSYAKNLAETSLANENRRWAEVAN